MTLMQEQAIDLIKRLPDDKIYYLVNFLEGFDMSKQATGNGVTESQRAYLNLQKFKQKGTVDRDYREELYSALEEKYASVD